MSFCFPCRKKVISCYIENSPERIRSSTSGKAISKKASYSFIPHFLWGVPQKNSYGRLCAEVHTFPLYAIIDSKGTPFVYQNPGFNDGYFCHILGHNHQEQILLDQPWWFSRFILPENFTYRGPNTSLQTSARCYWRQEAVDADLTVLKRFFSDDAWNKLLMLCKRISFNLTYFLLSTLENRESLKSFRNVDCVLANHKKV